MVKHYTDYERYEHCRKYKISGMNVSEYARVNKYTSKNNTLTKNKKNDILLVENKEDFILWENIILITKDTNIVENIRYQG